MRDYADKVRSGEIKRPNGLSLAASLAMLHRGGRAALDGDMLSDTAALVRRVEGMF
jgi:hypothetical protein